MNASERGDNIAEHGTRKDVSKAGRYKNLCLSDSFHLAGSNKMATCWMLHLTTVVFCSTELCQQQHHQQQKEGCV